MCVSCTKNMCASCTKHSKSMNQKSKILLSRRKKRSYCPPVHLPEDNPRLNENTILFVFRKSLITCAMHCTQYQNATLAAQAPLAVHMYTSSLNPIQIDFCQSEKQCYCTPSQIPHWIRLFGCTRRAKVHSTCKGRLRKNTN